MECLAPAPVLVLLSQGRGPGCLGERADSLRERGGHFHGGGAEFPVDMPKTTARTLRRIARCWRWRDMAKLCLPTQELHRQLGLVPIALELVESKTIMW